MKTDQLAVCSAAPACTSSIPSVPFSASPELLSVILKLTECQNAIKAYIDSEFDFMRDKSFNFDEEIYTCISTVGEMIGFQIVCQSQERVSHE